MHTRTRLLSRRAGNTTFSNMIMMNCANTSVVLSGSANVAFDRAIFFNNTGTSGGAIRIESGATASFTNCLFLNNTAVSEELSKGFRTTVGCNDISVCDLHAALRR